MYENILAAAAAHNCTVEQQADMSKYTSFRVGGPADLLVKPNSTNALSDLLKACKKDGVKPLILGRGTNVLVKDEGIRNVVLLMGEDYGKVEYCGSNLFKAEAGASLSKLCKTVMEYGFTGLEFAYGIPGTVGGAVYMNAGAYGGEMKDVILVSNHMNADGEKGSFQGEGIGLSYRHSNYMGTDLVVTGILLRLEKGNPDMIKMKMDQILERRKLKQPLEYPSAGSTFKRPEGMFAGKLIQDCGLKGKRVGGAEVSEKHAGFIINKDHASASDILQLIKEVQTAVKAETGVLLEPEVRIL